MTEIPSILSSEKYGDLQVAMVLTGPAYTATERDQVIGIEANPVAMATIAYEVGVIADDNPVLLPSQLFVVRDPSTSRAVAGTQGARVLGHAGSPEPAERYFWASDIGSNSPPNSSERAGLIAIAHAMGVSALTVLGIADWNDSVSLAGAYAEGLLRGQRPVHSAGDDPSRIHQAGTAVFDALSGRGRKRRHRIETVEAIAYSTTIEKERLDMSQLMTRLTPGLTGATGRRSIARILPPFIIHRAAETQPEQ